MISKARWLANCASSGEVGWFVLISAFTVVILGSGGAPLTKLSSELVGSDTGFTKAYASNGMAVLGSGLLLAFGVFTASASYRMLRNTIGRCELAEDELTWINQCPEYERMVEDRELMRLAANVRRVCRTYPSSDSLFVQFLGAYRALLKNYGSDMEKTRQARIQHRNEAANEGLEERTP